MNVANGFWLPILKVARIPTLVNVDGIEWERAKWGKLARNTFLLGAKLTAKHASELVVDSEEIGSYWSTRFNRSGTFIPYGGVFPEELAVEPELIHRGYILLVARFVPENSIAAFFQSAPELSKKYKVVIVENQTDTEMTVGGTVYFATEQLARNYVTDHNATRLSHAYLVHSSPQYTVTDNS
jgi:glycosyltransferase involved in cell wall biosynthesis